MVRYMHGLSFLNGSFRIIELVNGTELLHGDLYSNRFSFWDTGATVCICCCHASIALLCTTVAYLHSILPRHKRRHVQQRASR